MAIEDEIINISDIDVGTEILNSDKLIIETNNGTKLLSFKDFVIGEENITFKNKLVQGSSTGASSTMFDTVTGYNILTSDTTAGHVTKYRDVSGSIELGKFNYDAVTEFARLSATIAENLSEIKLLKANLAIIHNIMKGTDSTALNSVTLTTKAVNFIVSNAKFTATKGNNALHFDTVDLDPTATSSGVSFDPSNEENGFSIKYPNDGTFVASNIHFSADLIVGHGAEVYLYVDNALKATATRENISVTNKVTQRAVLSKTLYINPDQTVRIQGDSKGVVVDKGSQFSGSIL